MEPVRIIRPTSKTCKNKNKLKHCSLWFIQFSLYYSMCLKMMKKREEKKKMQR